MSPFPSTQVIHDDWSAHHQPVAAGTRTGTCTITTGAGAGWTPTAGAGAGTAGTTLYAAKSCRVQDLIRSTRATDAAGQPVAEHPYLVAIDADAPDIPVGARVHIDTMPDDPRLVGKILVVAASSYASVRFERDLTCDFDPTNQGA